MKPDTPLYREYERDMEQFAVDQVFKSRINGRLAVLYEHMLYRDMIDIPLARILPVLLKSYRIECRNPRMNYVIVCHEELDAEEAYPLHGGVAYVPLFSERNVLVFQDGYGCRYMDVSYLKTRVMNRPDLESRCFEVYPEHPMLLMMEVRRVLEGSIGGEKDIAVLEQALEQERLNPLYRRLILNRMIAYYDHLPGEGNGMEKGLGYLLRTDCRTLTREQRKRHGQHLHPPGLLGGGLGDSAGLRLGGPGSLPPGKLCEKIILQNLFDEDEKLLRMAADVFDAGKADSVILDYLCEHYNGTTEKMYRILEAAAGTDVETYDLEERLLGQMLFTSCTEHMDRVFELYVDRKRPSEALVKAFFTLRSMEYFMGRAPMTEQVSGYLEKNVSGVVEKDRVPVIYLLALTRYYASCSSLTPEQKKLCRALTDELLRGEWCSPTCRSWRPTSPCRRTSPPR